MKLLSLIFAACLAAASADFGSWKQEHGKSYTSAAEEAAAKLAYAANDKIISEHNAKKLSYWLGHNEFSDLTWEQFKAKYVGKLSENPALNRERNFDFSLLNETVTDDAVDWVTKGAVTPIKNQGQCGSCWSFSTTGSIEGAFQIAGNPLTSLSEQQLVSCDSAPHGGFDNGCNGGLMDNAFKYIEASGGLCTEDDYPYISSSGRVGLCKANCTPAVTITGFIDVPGEAGMVPALSKGPVSVAIEADKSAFQLYKGGVLDNPLCGKKLDHGVLAVGYGTDGGKAYYKVKNSWGATWGESGYIRMVQGKDQCGIADSASYPTGAKKAGPRTPTPPPTPVPPAPTPVPPTPGPPTPVPPPSPGPPPTPKPAHAHYGDPAKGCLPDETSVKIDGKNRVICSAPCQKDDSFKYACPTDVNPGVTAKPYCATALKAANRHCELQCKNDGECGDGGHCYVPPAPPAPGPMPPPVSNEGHCYFMDKSEADMDTSTDVDVPPTFAPDFYVGTQTSLNLAQGAVAKGNEVCCLTSNLAPCKVQVQGSGGDTYEEATMERIRSDSAKGQTISWWGSVMKKMQIAPAGNASAHQFVCAQYCPLNGKFASSIRIGDGKTKGFDKVKDEGEKTISQHGPGAQTVAAEHYHWIETILGVIPLITYDYYVNQKVTPAAPFYQEQQILNPTASFQPAGTVNVSFFDYTPANQSKMFDIDMDSIKSCQMSKSCNGQPSPAPPGLSLLDAAAMRDDAPAPAPKLAKADAAALPTFASDFVSTEEGLMVEHQGATTEADGSACCSNDAPQCVVQLAHVSETRYFDLTNQRVRTEDTISGTIQVDLFGDIQKTVQVNSTNGVDTCVKYCPLHNETLKPFSIDPTAKDMGKATIMGKQLEDFRYDESVVIHGIPVFKMSTIDFFVDTSGAQAVPVFKSEALTPFGGAQIGTTNTTYTSFVPGAPPASKFDIKGLDTCPQDPQCDQPPMQLRRLSLGQYRTFAAFAAYHGDV